MIAAERAIAAPRAADAEAVQTASFAPVPATQTAAAVQPAAPAHRRSGDDSWGHETC
jgi:hypothetical protein